MTRKVIILANVGNRDVKYKGQRVEPARERGAELYARYEQIAADVDLPILFPGLRYVESLAFRYPEIGDESAVTLALFYTDQQNPDHQADDTLEVAKIAKEKLLEEFHRGRGGLRFRGQKAIRLIPVRDNPSRYDRMHSFYEDYFDRNPHLQNPEENLCLTLLSGGTPQMNAMLLLHSIRHFGPNCVQVYVPPGEEAKSLRVGMQIAQMDARRRFNEALAVRQFRAAAKIAEDAFEGASGRASACRYAGHRLAFDFQRAREHCNDALRVAESSLGDYLETHRDENDRLEADASPGADKTPLLAELFYNIEIKYEAGEFVDVLGRIFRLQEEILTRIAEDHTALRADKKLGSQKKALDELPGLSSFLEHEYRTGGGGRLELEMDRNLNRSVLAAIAVYLARDDSGLSEAQRAKISEMAKFAKTLEKLAGRRNRSILAHGFEGVSEDEIERDYGSKTLVEDLRRALGKVLDRDLSRNPFFELSEKLRL